MVVEGGQRSSLVAEVRQGQTSGILATMHAIGERVLCVSQTVNAAGTIRSKVAGRNEKVVKVVGLRDLELEAQGKDFV